MEEVRQLVQEEGREARNLIAFHVAVDTPRSVSRKPPRVGAPPPRRAAPRCAGAARLRSASAGRDKRSELRARYWALLFGDLQRAIGEIYNTVEAHENLNECQEVILVLENYTRDFKALGEWFRLKWEYDNTPPPQRPQSLAWEIRKTDFVRPESRRTQSVKSSPSVSGKNSPCLSGHNTPSGKNSPNLTGKASPGSGKISPRISGHASTSPKGTIEFFSSKISAKITTKPEPKKETRLSDIKEKDLNVEEADKKNNPKNEDSKVMETKTIETGKVNSNAVPKQVVIKSPKRAAIDEKVNDLSEQAKATVAKLDAMENEFLAKQLTENAAKNDNMVNDDMEKENFKPVSVTVTDLELNDKESVSTESPAKSEDNFGDVSNDSSKSIDDKCLVPKGDSDKANEAKSLPNGTEIKKDEDDPMPSDKNTQKDKTAKEPKDSKSNAKPVVENHVTAKAVTTETSNKDEKSNSTLENGNTSDSPIDIDGKDLKKDPKKPESKPLTEQNKETDNAKKEDTKKQEPKATEVKTPVKPAYSQAAAKPKQVTAKTEVKPPAKTTLLRSKTVVEIRPSVASKTRQFVNRNPKNKCSYPFNLTTGRTSLFDAPGNKVVTAKKPIIKPQMASGDSRNQTKDIKTRPPRPMSLKINEKGDEKDKINPGFEKIKDIDDYSSSDTIVAQLDMSRIESSESLKTLVPENGQDVANSIEVLNIDGDSKNDNEGWLTVKSRRLSRESKKSKSHWANRFRQPSATTSLPTLNMIESPKSETNPINTSKLDRAKSEQPQNVLEPPVKVAVQPKIEKIRDTSMIRQKSDVTGLRTRSSRTKALKKDKKDKKGSELTKNRLHSSLESLTTGLARSQESTEDAFDFDKWKSEFKSTFRYLEDDDQISNHNEILRTADPSEMSEIAEMTSQIEENERKISLALDFQSEVDQRKLSEEEELLNRQIMELQQNSDVDLDTETDDTETDAEIPCECEEGGAGGAGDAGGAGAEALSSLAARLEHQYETALAGMSWAERVDTLGALEALVARDPGRAMQLHAKLSAGLRRRGSLTDALRRLQAKQARADTQRNTLATQRKRRIHALLARVEEVKVAKNQLIEEKRIRMERRLQKAAENRDQHLKDIVRKAHDEEEKLREIAFIKQLEAENRRHEFLDQCRSHTTRLREMRRERLDKLAAAAAREAAVGARRAALEQARSHRVALLLQRRQLQHDRQQRLQQQRQQQHKHANREKAEGVRSRLSALARAAEAEAAALRTRITSKEAASTQRLQHHLQAIRERATTRTQTTSESHQEDQESREEEQAAARIEQERKDRDKQKSIRKKARKMKQKLMETSKDPRLPESASNRLTFPPAIKLHKVITQLSNIIEPLIHTETPIQNGLVNEEDKAEKKKKNKVKNDENDNNNHEVKTEEVVEKVEEVAVSEVKTGEVKEGKKKKKKNKSSDGPKLSKSNSICSSLSDMSRTSVRSEKVNTVADVQTVEKLLNELHRILMANDKWPESSLPTKQFAIKTLGNLVSLAAERDDIVTQFTTKSITTCIVCTSRLICASAATAECYVWSPHVANTVLLLAKILEKDIQADAKDMELAKHTSDCLSVGLDSVLCATRLFTGPEGGKQLAENRARAHSIISYLCLSGCISRAEKAGEVRESIQTLLTLCADLCQPNEVDTGPELSSATQSLRCALGTSLCGSRDEFCMLFAEGAELAKSSSFVRAARTAHLLRAVAELDHIIVQEAFGEGGWPLEFRAAVARLLSQHAPSDREAPRSTVVRLSTQRLDQTLSETMVLDLIVLVGFVVVNNPQLHETICENWSVVKTLCTLPCNWLVSPTHCHSLLPTLVVLAERADTAPVIAAELSMKMLEEYCDSPDAQKVKLIQVFKQGRERHRKAMKKEQEQQEINEEPDN